MARTNLREFNKIVENLNREIYKLKRGTMKGLMKAAELVHEDMDSDSGTPPLVPERSGRLRNSWFTVERYEKTWIGVFMGFDTPYAAYVHELVDATYTRPGSGPKYFQSSLFRNKWKILDVIVEEARIK